MEIPGNALNSALGGIQAGQRRVDQAAASIAGNSLAAADTATRRPAAQSGATASQADMAANLVEMSRGKHEVRASARVIETADELLGTLIDTRA